MIKFKGEDGTMQWYLNELLREYGLAFQSSEEVKRNAMQAMASGAISQRSYLKFERYILKMKDIHNGSLVIQNMTKVNEDQ